MDKKVGELLDLACIQIGRVESKFEPLSISKVVEDISSHISSLSGNKEQSMETRIAPSRPKVRGDRDRIEEILLNLWSNTNKFSPFGRHIPIAASEAKARY